MRFTLRQRVETSLARALVGLPASAIRRLLGRPVVRDGRELDAHADLVLRAHRWLKRPPTHALDVAAARREMEYAARILALEPPELARVDELSLAGPAGSLAARVHRPRGLGAPAPALVHFHGGGFVVGSLDSHAAVCAALAAEVPCVVVSVDYRLAPEHPFPAGVDDAVAAFRQVAARAAELGLDPRRLAVGGDSAGGTLAAVVGLETRADATRPCLQLLVYPAVDLTHSFPSVRSLGEGFFLEKATIDWFMQHYLPSPDAARDPRASPWFAPDLAGAPPAFVLTAGFDPLRDEGDAYAARLREAGVAAEHCPCDSLFHGFLNAAALPAARLPFARMVAALRRAFAP